ncbi:trigger factor [Cyanobium sp. NIES-981]|uniref:trigger factor n=1 Tax=Cyanobium sp. NIES-981 TaxID=1851505 RepID=UPI0007DDDC05|nr:trigger factor [Cyanobium sp. NIES-981]SBO44054.1 Trigger factor [Cyanobium sp. NIES-981]
MSPAAASPAPTSPSSAGDALTVKASPRPGSRVALEVAISGARSQASYDAALEKLSRSVKLPGFRKGKVPRPVLLQQIGPLRLRATALEELVDAAFRDALALEEVAPIGRPELSEAFEAVLERFQPGTDLSFTLELDVEPSPSLKKTRGLQAEAEAISYDPARVDELIEQSRRQLATLVPVEHRSAESGDVAVLAFSGVFTDTGEAISGGSSEATEVELEEGRMIPGFVEGVIGMAVGESRSVECQFPQSYPQEDAAGRAARFEISLKDLKARELPALDDAFAQQASDKQTLADLRSDLETRLKEEAERRAKAARHEALLGALVEELEVELPETLVQQEIRNLIEQTAGQIAQQGMDVKKLFTPDLVRSLMDTSRPEAEQRLRRSLALQALAKAEAITVEDTELEAKVKEISRGLSQQGNIDPARLRQVVADDLLQEKLLDWLEVHSTVTEKVAASEPEDTTETETPAAAPAAAKASSADSQA